MQDLTLNLFRKDALNRQESYQYDPAGNLTQFIDRKNQQSTFSYDALNRRTGASYADGSSTSFTYDSVGRLARATDSVSGTIEFSDDTLDRLTKEITPQGTVTYQYDALGRRSQMVANGGSPVTYQYDAASRLTQVAQGTQLVGLGYDAAGRRTSLAYPNGTNASYTYDNASRLTHITHNGPAGLIESLSYTYDAAGNRISLTRSNGTATLLPAAVQAAYDAANQQIQFNAASPNQTFDANGNLTTQTDASGTTTYTWDARNRLTVISGPGLSASFSYDAQGRRISKTINGVTTQYFYDGNEVVAEIGAGAVVANYITSLRIDEPFVRVSTSNEFYHADAQWNVLALSNAVGTSTVNYTYESFGETNITGTSSNPLQFTSRENDGTGLYYFRARYYFPSHKRFISEDAIRFSGGLNFFTYAQNNPLYFVDPSGLDTVSLGLYTTALGGYGAISGFAVNGSYNKKDGFCVSLSGTAGLGGGAGIGGALSLDLQYTNASNVNGLNGPFINAGLGAGVGIVGGVNYIKSPDGSVTGGSGSIGVGVKSTFATPVWSTLLVTTTGTVFGFCTTGGFFGPTY